ncbi:MAG: helix-turn-helix domain-containing protein [Acetivibrio ethanolgignens]
MCTGKRMKDRRKALDLKAEEVADALGCSRSTIFRYENGAIEKVPSSIIKDIAEILHTTPEYLMGWTDNPRDYENDPDIQVPSEALKMGITPEQWVAFKQAEAEDAQRESSLPEGAIPYTPEAMVNIPLVGYDGYNDDGSIRLNMSEVDLVEKYRAIDDHGKEMVNIVLDKEYERYKNENKSPDNTDNNEYPEWEPTPVILKAAQKSEEYK